MSASPIKRYTRYVKPANATLAATPGTLAITFPHPVDPYPTSIPPSMPSTGNNVVIGAPRGTVGPNLLAQGADQMSALAGTVSAHLGATFAIAAVFLTKIELVDASGNLLDTLFSDAVGLVAGAAGVMDPTALAAVTGIPVLANQGLKITLLNTAGAVGPGAVGIARYDLGVDVQQPFGTAVGAAI